ncbi:unnamed protein product [Prorocentrum cordatum]|uniref:Uncharacterized protein n=1 Tax=Prorocentrum cordatum TaxID=2364126 RepID=A0ABN9VL13_9DINO|nr:unnamed protein product [Polarella glacialis]
MAARAPLEGAGLGTMAAGRRPRRPSEALWGPQRERRAAQRWAALSRERLVERQASELAELRGLASAPPSVLRRLALVAPVLIAQEYGGPLEEERILERNAGRHARALPRPGAPRAAWRRAQRGLRPPCPRSAVAASSAKGGPRAVGADAIHVADIQAGLLAEADAQLSGGALPPPPGVWLVADPLAGARAFREGFDAGWRLAGTAFGAPRGGDGVVLQEQRVPSSSFRGVWEVCSDGACGGGQAAPAARAEPGPPCEGVWKAGAAMEEGGRAALHGPRRAIDGVQGGTAGERAPRPPLLLESLAGPGSDDGFVGGGLDGPVDGDADGDAACP